jgi:hypothetical protein
MKIRSVDFFYLSMPVVTDAGDGMGCLVVRVRAGGNEARQIRNLYLVASYLPDVCGVAAGRCLGARDVSTIITPSLPSMGGIDLLQAAHTWSGVEIALGSLGRSTAAGL